MKRSTRFWSAGLVVGVGGALALSAQAAPAPSAADMLMQAVAPAANPGAPSVPVTPTLNSDRVVLNTPIARSVFAEWNSSRAQAGASAFEVDSWTRLFLAEKFEAAAHLWGVVSSKAPDSFIEFARGAQLYSLYRLGLAQTFFDQWMTALGNPKFAESRASVALEESITPGFEAWFVKNNVQLSPDSTAVIARLGANRSVVLLTLNAAALERQGEAAAQVIERLPLDSVYRPRLALTYAVALARKNDLTAAARILKSFYEPWLAIANDPAKTSSYYMQIARLLYQAGAYEGARQYYEKIPNGSADYLTAREELAWVWLRSGESEKLRGNLKTLTSTLLEDKFQPEAYLVRAISNLKLCYHSEVEKDFRDFLKVNQKWATLIGKNLKETDPASPRIPDFYSLRAEAAEKSRSNEIAQLKGLSERSIAAVLPAVGPQKHWTEALQKASASLESAKKTRVAEFRRQWKNDQSTLVEAIRKMQFVKVELMSQLALLNVNQPSNPKAAELTTASGADKSAATVKSKIRSEGDMVFPFDGVVWPDELFKLRAQANSQCLGNL